MQEDKTMNKKNVGNFISSLSHTPTLILQGQIAFLARNGAIWFWGNLFAASLFVLLRWVEQDENMLLMLVWYCAIVALGIMPYSAVTHP